VAQSGIRGAANVKFDPLKFTWLGSLSNYGNEAYLLWVNVAHPAKSVADINRLTTPTRLGAVSGGTNMMISLVAKETLGLNVKVIRGYVSGPAVWLAMDRGEVDGQTIGLTSVMAENPEKWEKQEIRPLLQFGRATRLAAFADLPTARELAPTPQARAIVEFAELPFLTSLPYVAPPNLPADRARALQAAFVAMGRDEAFIAEAGKRRVELSPIDGGEIMAVLRRSAATPKQVIDRFNAILEAQN
jgi:tripartite-type tricarboxylate transporter receptor subunit TctC